MGQGEWVVGVCRNDSMCVRRLRGISECQVIGTGRRAGAAAARAGGEFEEGSEEWQAAGRAAGIKEGDEEADRARWSGIPARAAAASVSWRCLRTS